MFYIDDISQSTLPTLKTEPSINIEMKVYPNPTSGLVHISDVSNVDSITISNVNGQVVKSFGAQNTIDISDLTAGIYILITDNGLIRKIIKQ